MSSTLPRFVSLEPVVIDKTRVSLQLKTTNFPASSNVTLHFDIPSAQPPSPNSAPSAADAPIDIEESQYPIVELSLLDAQEQEVAEITIIEHQEEDVEFTLHLRQPQPRQSYTARARMIFRQETIDTLDTPFVLEAPNSARKVEA